MKHAHTAGDWYLDIGNGAIYARHGASFDSESELVERIATMRPTCVTDRWEADGDLLALAPTAPHDCDISGCPGAENKRRLEAWERMLIEHEENKRKLEAAEELLEAADQALILLCDVEKIHPQRDRVAGLLGAAIRKAQDAKVGK